MLSLTKTAEVTLHDVAIGHTLFLPSRSGRVVHRGKRGQFVKVVATRGTYRDRTGSHLIRFGPARLQFVKLAGPQQVLIP